MFPAGKKDASDAAEYDGGRSSDAIIAWALDKLAENVPPPETIEVCLTTVILYIIEDDMSVCLSVIE